MGHVTKNVTWATLDIALDGSLIFVQQNWLYIWATAPGMSAWTYQERRSFHARADTAIWRGWSDQVTLQASGSSEVARKLAQAPIPVNFDIRWVLSDPHWTVQVTKIPKGNFRVSSVNWGSRTIHLDSEDAGTRRTSRTINQVPVAHEFGHAVGNTVVLGRGDEYHPGHAHHIDRAAMMNVGHELRERYFRTLIEELNDMIPGVTFSIHGV